MALAWIRLICLAMLLLVTGQTASASDRNSPEAPNDLHLSQRIDAIAGTAGNWPRLHSLLVSQGGQVVYEQYFNGRRPSQLDNVKSVSKSVLSGLVGIAIARGDIGGVDATLSEYFPAELAHASSDRVRRITVENLLTMQAGLQPMSSANYGAWVASDNWVRTALTAPLEATPGEEMLYSTGSTHLLSAIVTRATGKSLLQFAREALADPLGFRLAPWPHDPQGIYFGGNNMEFTPRQMLALGELYLNDGRAGGDQVIPERWVRDSLAPHAKSPHGDGRYYGYGWWLEELAGYAVPHAWGHGGQFIMLVPELDLVIVTTSAADPGPAAQVHANNVYGLLQRVIRVVAAHDPAPRLYFAENLQNGQPELRLLGTLR